MKLSQLTGLGVLVLAGIACGSGSGGAAADGGTTGRPGTPTQTGSGLPFSNSTGQFNPISAVTGLFSPISGSTGSFSPISTNPGAFAPGGSTGGGSADCLAVCDRFAAFRCGDAGLTGTPNHTDCQASCSSANAATIAACLPAINAYLDCYQNLCDHPEQLQPGAGNQPCRDETRAIDACQGGGSTGAGGSTGLGGTPYPGTGGFAGLGGSMGLGGNPQTGTGGSTSTGDAATATYTCADLQACCARAPAANQTTCNGIYTQALPSGDAVCSAVLSQLKATYCP